MGGINLSSYHLKNDKRPLNLRIIGCTRRKYE
nr:MAG TPA: hypothetical protein [Caudoviricetes sp.]